MDYNAALLNVELNAGIYNENLKRCMRSKYSHRFSKLQVLFGLKEDAR